MHSKESCFSVPKPIIGVIHCKGSSNTDVLERAIKEINLYESHGLDGVLIETYFGTYPQVAQVLNYLAQKKPRILYGVNCLNVDAMGFELANAYQCKFLQIDSVVGHVKPRDEATLDAFFKLFRSRCKSFLLGGVRFKYQPLLSANSLEQDLAIAKTRCDAICVTENATGEETSLSKIRNFRDALDDFPLFVCAGVTPENITEQMRYVDGAVVGSYFKDNYQDNGEAAPEHIERLMGVVRNLRNCL